jgi:hypothetical protein
MYLKKFGLTAKPVRRVDLPPIAGSPRNGLSAFRVHTWRLWLAFSRFLYYDSQVIRRAVRHPKGEKEDEGYSKESRGAAPTSEQEGINAPEYM